MKKQILLIFITLCLIFLGCNSSQKITGKDDNMQNKEKAIAVLKALETGDKLAIEKYINENKYIQHNLAFPDGRETLLNALEQLKQAGVKVNIARVISDGDFVAIHTDYDFFGPKIGFDVFRFENGKIVEHWDNLQEKVEKTPSGHTMIDGPKEIKDLDKTEANKTLVKNFYETVLIGGAFDKMGEYFDGDKYIQHNPMIADGLSGLGNAIQELAKQGLYMKFDKLHYLIGEGNFVLIMCEGSMGDKPTAFYDLFRVENNKIVEHWDVIETILPKEQWKNNNGKF